LKDYLKKIVDVETLQRKRGELKQQGQTLVFTNGCFDILHTGHVDYLAFARHQGDALAIGLNSDASVRKNKGTKRPIIPENERARMLAALEVVTFVVIFDEEEPAELIRAILPDVLVKGEDWAHRVVGREIVEQHGGRVVLAPLTHGWSTTEIIRRITEAYT
jgi:D-beta-D-heptose 7-phosphate kinase/D-beta-D-heptose 1-phosphate adenosyltransferase